MINEASRALIKSFESFSPDVYLDPAGIPSIGYGHVVRKGETFGTISEDTADQLLGEDLANAEYEVNHFIHPDMLNENRYGALVSLTFNCGQSPLIMTLGHLLNQGDIMGCADQFLRWDKITVAGKKVASEGLTRRRKAERALFLTPILAVHNI